MPAGDRTGPMGRGSRTGRGLGYCAGYDQPGRVQPGPGRGFGRGGGWGRGFGRGGGWGRGFGRGGGWGRGFGRGGGRGSYPDVVDPYYGDRYYDDPYYADRRPYYEDDRSRRPYYEGDRSGGPDTYGGDEKADLLNYVKDLEAELTAVKKRLEGLSAKKK